MQPGWMRDTMVACGCGLIILSESQESAVKHSILLMCVALLVACEPESSYRERAETHERFAEAQQVLDRAVAGTIGHDVEEDPYGKPVYEYRREQYEAAAELLRPLTTSADDNDRVAAATVLAEAATNQAHALLHEASSNWTALLNTHARLLSAVNDLRDAHTVQTEHEAIDLSGQMDELREETETLLADREAVEQRIAAINERIAELEAQIEQAQQQRREIDAKADELSREAFQSEGQQQYDLYVEAAELSEQSGALSSEIEAAEGKVDLEQSQLALEQVEVDQIDTQVEQYREAVEELERRQAEVAELAEEASERLAERAEHFDELVAYLREGFEEEVEALVPAALEYFEEAEQQLHTARQAARQETRQLLNMRYEAARGNYGRAYANVAGMRENYRNLLLGVAEASNEVMPDQAASLSELAAEVGERAEYAARQGEELLRRAAEELAPMVEPAEARGDTDLQRAVLQHLVVVYRALENVTGEGSYGDRAAEYRDEMRGL